MAADQFDLDVRVTNATGPAQPDSITPTFSIATRLICTRITCQSCTCVSCITLCPGMCGSPEE